jgi:uncharacterized membrane protein SpoIIM required for sporulation
VKVDRFIAERQQAWVELQDLIDRAGSRPSRLGAEGLRRLAALYRAAAADLAAARLRFPRQSVVDLLERLVHQGRRLVYAGAPRRFFGPAWRYLSTGYFQEIAARPAPLALAAALLFGSAGLAWVWATLDPVAASGIVPEGFQDVLVPGISGTDLGMSGIEQAAFSWYVFTNNVLVTFGAFGFGIAFGLGTALALVYNGGILGVVGGVLVGSGNGGFFVELVAAHGAIELSCVVIAGAAGLRLGWSILAPGLLTRRASLAAEGRRAAGLLAGTMVWLGVAGLIEGVISRRGLDALSCAAIGLASGAVFWGLVVWRGRFSEAAELLRSQVGGGARRAEPVGGRFDHIGARPA